MAVETIRLARRAPASVLHPMDGFGAQFNTNLFTSAGRDQHVGPHQLQQLRSTITKLKPGHSRVFIRRGMRADTTRGQSAPEFLALMDTIELAQRAGANVNLTWWGQGPYADEGKLRTLVWPNRTHHDWPNPNLQKWPKALTDPDGLKAPKVMMERFAGILEEARSRGFDCVRYATIQNEVNGSGTDIAKHKDPFLSMRFYELLYRHLDTALKAAPDPKNPSRTLRSAIRLVAGDLVEKGNSRQDLWLKYMHANMDLPRPGFPSVVDAYSIHVYWEPGPGPQGFPRKLEARLTNLERTVRSLGIKKPIYVTEYGVRLLRAKPRPGKLGGQRLEQTAQAALQHAWFNALAPQFGCVGLAKWVLYRTDKTAGFGHWGMVDAPAAEFKRTPTYRITRLFNHLIGPGWKAAGLGRGAGGTLLASRFAGPNQQESVVVLNRGVRAQQVRVEGLKSQTTYVAVVWNQNGDPTLQPLPKVVADARGAATITVPQHGLVALSTRRHLKL
jgi:hypothetical protein